MVSVHGLDYCVNSSEMCWLKRLILVILHYLFSQVSSYRGKTSVGWGVGEEQGGGFYKEIT